MFYKIPLRQIEIFTANNVVHQTCQQQLLQEIMASGVCSTCHVLEISLKWDNAGPRNQCLQAENKLTGF